MTRRFLSLLVSLLLLSPWTAWAQRTAKGAGPGKLTKVAVQNVEMKRALDELRLFYESRPDEVNNARGSGYKPFKRMEWFLESRLNDDGTYPVGALWNAFIDKQAASERNAPISTLAAANWTSLGPYGLSNPNFPASGTNASSGGRMLDFAFDPNDASVIYAGAASGGLWRSPDDGLSWAPVDDQLPVLSVSCVVTHPTNSSILYIGTGEGYGNVGAVSGVGVLKSTDGGASWSNTGLSFAYSSGTKVNELVIDASNPNVLIAATSGGVYRTTDGGTNWSQTLTASPAFDLVIDANNSNNVFTTVSGTASTGGIYKSTDNGATWVQLTTANGLPGASTHKRISMDIGTSNSQVLYASFTNTSDGLQGVYKTTDGGSNWALTTATPPNFLGAQGWYDNVTTVDPNDEDIVYAGGVDAYKTTDGGANWSSVHNNIHVDYHAISFHNGAVYAGNDGGVYKTTNGGSTWTNLSLNGLVTHQYYKFGTAFDNANKLMGGCQDNGLNEYLGSPDWTKRRGGDGMEVIYDYTNSSIVYGENQSGSRLRSTDGGANWTSINTGAPSGPWVTPFEMDPAVPTTLYTIGNTSGGNGDLYRTTNSGSNWSLLFNATEDLGRDIKVAPNNNQVIYVLGPSVVYYSSNGGATFNLGTGLPVTSALTYVAVDPTNAQIAYITRGAFAGTHVYKTTNGGATWTNITGTLPNIPAVTVAIDPTYPNNVYVGTDLGVYLSTDAGATWSDWSDNLPNVVIDELEIHASSRLIRAASHGRGIWESNLNEPANPPFADAGADQTICVGSSVQIGGNPTGSGGAGSFTYLWNPATGLDNATTANPTASPTSTTTYTVQVTDANGVTVADNMVVTVNPLPVVTFNPVGPYCINTAAVDLSSAISPSGGTFSGSGISGNMFDPATAGAGTHSITYSYTDGNNCSNSASQNITVNALPTASISGDDPVVTGTTHSYSANTNASSPSYSWSVTNGTINGSSTSSSVSVTAGAVGTMVVDLSVIDGSTTCSNSATKNVTVNANTLAANAGNDASVCLGGSTNLDGTASGGSGSYTFLWNVQSGPNTSSGQFNDATLEDPVFTPTLAGSYVLQFTVDDGVVSPESDDVTITVNALPTASISGDDPVVTGTTHSYTANTNASSPSYSWSVTTGTINGSSTSSSVSVTAGAVGTMVVDLSVTDGSTTCSNSATKNVTVNANTLAANAGNDASLCLGGSTNLDGTASGGSGTYTFLWNVQSGPNTSSGQFNDATLEDPVFTPTLAGSYVLQFTVDDGVVSPESDDVTITVNALPTASISGDDPVVTGTTHSYTANTNASSPSYSWSVTNGTINGSSTSSSVSVTAGAVGTMVVDLSVTDGSTTCSNSATKNVTVGSSCNLVADAGSDVGPIYTGDAVTLGGNPTATGVAPFSYSWSPTDGLNDPTGANPTARPTATTTYTVEVTDANGCTASNEVTVFVHDYVILSNGQVKFDANQTSDGNIHSNGIITFGSGMPGTHTGNLTARDDISISTRNTIVGDAISGDEIYLSGSATVTGTADDHASVAAISMPNLSFTAGGPNKTVSRNGSLTLLPGSYGTVKVRQNGTLNLSAGNYFINLLDTDAGARLSCNVSAGGVNIHVVQEAEFDDRVQILTSLGDAGSGWVTVKSRQTIKMDIGVNCRILGAFIVPRAEIYLSAGCRFKGSMVAASVSVEDGVPVLHHNSSTPLPKASAEMAEAGAIATDYVLEQNYPNPFNPATQISFSVKETGVVQLTVFNLAGQVVRTLASETMNAGWHELTWDGRDEAGAIAPSGIYFYRLRVNGFEQTRKMMLMK